MFCSKHTPWYWVTACPLSYQAEWTADLALTLQLYQLHNSNEVSPWGAVFVRAWANPPNACSPREGKEEVREGRKQVKCNKAGCDRKVSQTKSIPVGLQPSMLRTFPPSAASSVRLDIYLSAALNRWQEAQVSVQLFLTLGEVECQRLGLNQCNLSFKQDEWRKYEWLLRKMFGKWL